VHGRGARLALVAGRNARLGAVASETCPAAGSMLTRFEVFDAGRASAKDPIYTVIPQHKCIAAQQTALGR
jgi:hypothetical protein